MHPNVLFDSLALFLGCRAFNSVSAEEDPASGSEAFLNKKISLCDPSYAWDEALSGYADSYIIQILFDRNP